MLRNKIKEKSKKTKNFVFLPSFILVLIKPGPKIELNKVPENDPNV